MPKKKRHLPLHHSIKTSLGYPKNAPEARVLSDWRLRTRHICKPCWELRYCPYGPLVEQFPCLPPIRSSAIEHNAYLGKCRASGVLASGERLDPGRRRYFTAEVRSFRPSDYPDSIPDVFQQAECSVFGHICPVFSASEGFTETEKGRRTGRYIPFLTKMRVVRRDNYTCQHCKKHLLDTEVEFDHIIPLSRGGSTDEQNLRLTCHDCNADKSDRVSI